MHTLMTKDPVPVKGRESSSLSLGIQKKPYY